MGPNQWCYQVPQYWATGGGGATVDCNHQIEKLLITNVSIHPSQPAVIITWLENRKITWMRSFSIPNIRQGGQIWLPTISFLLDHFYIARAGLLAACGNWWLNERQIYSHCAMLQPIFFAAESRFYLPSGRAISHYISPPPDILTISQFRSATFDIE